MAKENKATQELTFTGDFKGSSTWITKWGRFEFAEDDHIRLHQETILPRPSALRRKDHNNIRRCGTCDGGQCVGHPNGVVQFGIRPRHDACQVGQSCARIFTPA